MWSPIELKAQPFQQTSRPEKLDSGVAATCFTMGMIFSLVPVSLAVDMVYDREVRLFFIEFIIYMYFFSDKGKKSVKSQWAIFINVLHNILYHPCRPYDNYMCGFNSTNIYIRPTISNSNISNNNVRYINIPILPFLNTVQYLCKLLFR